MSDEYDEEMEDELRELSQEIGERVKEIAENIHPMRVALAGVIFIMLIGALASTWYWVIPRDDVEIDVMYLQRNGHVVLTELVNDGSREITNVTLTVEFVDDVRGYSVWDEYTIQIEIVWTNFRGEENTEQFLHKVSENVTEKFHNDCEEVTWFL